MHSEYVTLQKNATKYERLNIITLQNYEKMSSILCSETPETFPQFDLTELKFLSLIYASASSRRHSYGIGMPTMQSTCQHGKHVSGREKEPCYDKLW